MLFPEAYRTQVSLELHTGALSTAMPRRGGRAAPDTFQQAKSSVASHAMLGISLIHRASAACLEQKAYFLPDPVAAVSGMFPSPLSTRSPFPLH
eukprot:6177666-Pleurochrysis_carterae.AAC.2